METQANRYISAAAVFAAASMFFGVAYAVMMGWFPMVDHGEVDSLTQSRHGRFAVPAEARCGRCGVIESVREIDRTGNSGSFGAAAGGKTGAATGRQAGGGFNTDLLTVIGVVLGAMVGNRYPQEVEAAGVREVTVRFGDGSSRVLTARGPQAWKTGDRVKIIGGRIQPDA